MKNSIEELIKFNNLMDEYLTRIERAIDYINIHSDYAIVGLTRKEVSKVLEILEGDEYNEN